MIEIAEEYNFLTEVARDLLQFVNFSAKMLCHSITNT